MKRFNADKELSKLERRHFKVDNKSLANLLVPVFVLCASALFLVGASFSLNIGELTDSDLSYREDGVIIDGLTINDDNGISVYFTNDQNRYVLFNDMLFRLVRVNGDGTVRLMLVEGINKTYLDGSENARFNYDFTLDIETNINNWFNYYFVNNVFVVDGLFDTNKYKDDTVVTDLINNENHVIKKVGLLSFREYNLVFRYDNGSRFYLNNYNLDNQRYCVFDGILTTCDDNYMYDVLPVINIKVDNFTGDGSIDSPYQIEEFVGEEV